MSSSTALSPTTSARLFRSEDELAALPASERIRYRLIAADRRFHANDNIAAHVRAEDDRAACKVRRAAFPGYQSVYRGDELSRSPDQ